MGIRTWTITCLVFLLLAVLAGPAEAVGLSTRYPGIAVRPGERVTLSLKVTSPTAGETVALELPSVPDGWGAAFRGGGFTVHQVFSASDEPSFVDLQLRVPPGVAPGTYPVTVRATGASGTATLRLSLVVNPAAVGSAELDVEFPVLQGSSGTRFNYRLTLRNDSGEKQLFTLAADAPAGWVVSFKPAFGGTETTSIPAEPGGTERIDVTVQTPGDVQAGTYTIPVRASAPGVTAATELTAVITGSYRLEIRTADERFSTRATAGRETPVKLVLANTGTAPLTGLELSSYEPSGWTVTFKPEKVDGIPAGETREVTALIKPKSRALAGDYVLSVTARAREARDSAEFRVSVTTPTTWGIFGVLLAAAAVAGTYQVVRTYGRR